MKTITITLSDAQLLALRLAVMKSYIDFGIKTRGRRDRKEVEQKRMILQSLYDMVME